jgi:predicted acetyltransferase
MTLEVRTVDGVDELREFAEVHAVAFGHRFEEERLAKLILPALEQVTCVAAYDAGRMVGVSVDQRFEITLPGGRFAPASGVTWVGVLPTERRRGALRALLDHQHADFRERGVPLSILYASQTTIYGRFGYGPATVRASEADVDTRHGAYANPFQDSGSVVMIDDTSPVAIVREVIERSRPQIPGEVDRQDSDIADMFADADKKQFRVAHRDAGGGYDGFATYKIEPDWEHDAIARNRIVVGMLLSASIEAHAAIWRYLLDLDLVRTVSVGNRPLDDPIRWLLAEWRHYRVRHVSDGLWLKMVDPVAALEARGYAIDGRLVLDLEGDRLLLEAMGGGEARCTATSLEPQIEVDHSMLAAAYLGGVRFASLRDGRRLRELEAGACQRADLMFASERDPWCSYEF